MGLAEACSFSTRATRQRRSYLTGTAPSRFANALQPPPQPLLTSPLRAPPLPLHTVNCFAGARHVFCGLDNIFSDIHKKVLEIFGPNFDKIPHTEFWKRLSSITDGPHGPSGPQGFFDQLEWKADGRELWQALKPLNPTILTDVTAGDWTAVQKRRWCRRELGPDTKVIGCTAKVCLGQGRPSRVRGFFGAGFWRLFGTTAQVLHVFADRCWGNALHNRDTAPSKADLEANTAPQKVRHKAVRPPAWAPRRRCRQPTFRNNQLEDRGLRGPGWTWPTGARTAIDHATGVFVLSCWV